jgi:hypothetical protein
MAGQVVKYVICRMHTKFYSGNLNGRDQLKDVCIGVGIILKWILKK